MEEKKYDVIAKHHAQTEDITVLGFSLTKQEINDMILLEIPDEYTQEDLDRIVQGIQEIYPNSYKKLIVATKGYDLYALELQE